MTTNIHTLAVLGAGTMGRGIAHVAALAGYETRCYDPFDAAREKAAAAVERNLAKGVEIGKVDSADAAGALGRLTFTGDLAAAVGGADLVIEAVPESVKLKIETFGEVSRHAPEHALYATNTSALSVTEIATRTRRPDRIIGLHFQAPVPLVPLVEVVRGLATSEATLRTALDFVRVLGKTGVEVFEYPGYVTTRVIVPFLNEAMHVVMEGVATAEAVDTSMKLGYGLPVGPLALADRMGLDEVMRWMQYLFDELGDLKYRPCPLLRKMIRAGHLGVKSGRGFFVYPGGPASATP